MVLLLVMFVTVISLGFVARMDTELVCGDNTLLRLQMDQLAHSGLEHAKGLILHPQDVPAAFWATGAAGQQLAPGSQDYYDVQVAPDGNDPTERCIYRIDCEAYRLDHGQKTGRSRLTARLRLDPCIGLWVGAAGTLWPGVTVYGDVSCAAGLANAGAIDGDVFAPTLTGAGIRTGRLNPQPLTLAWPPVTAAYTNSPAYQIVPMMTPVAGTYQPDRIWRHVGNLIIGEPVTIRGMLLVDGNLTIGGNAHGSRMIAPWTLPALYVRGNLEVIGVNGLQIEGLVVVGRNVTVTASTVTIAGGLFIGDALDGVASIVTITADPMRAAILAGAAGSQTEWSPAAAGFYRRVGRP
ncbi:MAG: hypothetical protein MUC88_11665 [Planctomycetes bacterium]|nr:hypothetical protein [Planctomycetota bacterium]